MRTHTSSLNQTTSTRWSIICAILLLGPMYSTTTLAANRTWDGSASTNWNANSNWVGDGPSAGNGDTAVFSINFNNQPSLTGITPVDKVTVTSPNKNVVITANGADELRLGRDSGDGIQMSGATRNLRIDGTGLLFQTANDGDAVTWDVAGAGDGNLIISTNNMAISNSVTLTIDVSSGRTVTIDASINSTAASIIKANDGLFRLNNDNSFSGGLQINDGTVEMGHVNALGNNLNVLTMNGASNGVLQLQGTDPTLKGLSSTATSGGSIIENGAGGNSTLTVNVAGAESYTYDDILRNGGPGTLGLTKEGTGTQTLTGTSSYTGATLISGGELIVTGDISSSSMTTIAGGTLSGDGTVGALTVAGGTISPGNSPGTMAAGNTIWADASDFLFEINDVDAGAGVDPGWDLLDITGTLDITATLGGFTIDIVSFGGPVGDFDPTMNYVWDFVHTTGGITGFDESDFTLDSSGFLNSLAGGSFSIRQSGNNLELLFNRFTPEPSSLVLATLGVIGLLCGGRRRIRKA